MYTTIRMHSFCVMISIFSWYSISRAADNRPRPLTAVESVLAGSIAGAAELPLGQLFNNIKTKIQQGQSIDWHPRALYKNIGLAAGCIIPTTAAAKAVDEIAPIAAGPISGIVATPIENIAQRRLTLGISVAQAAQQRALTCGMRSVVGREAIWAPTLFHARPELQQRFKKDVGLSDNAATVCAGATAGVTGAIVSHPCDVIATIAREGHIQRSMPPHMAQHRENLQHIQSDIDAAKHIYKTKGVQGFTAGMIPRTMRAGAACVMIGKTLDVIPEVIIRYTT